VSDVCERDTAVHSGWATAAPLVALLGLWVGRHPYLGIIHDARLYTFQALHKLHPAELDPDIYFKYGSQDSLTVFSRLYAPLIGAFGIAAAHLLAALAGQLVWIIGLVWLLTALFNDRRALLAALAAVFALPYYYGGQGVFSYAEAFATPRIFAEALILAAFGFALRHRIVLASLLFLAAAAIHPIMAATGIGVLLVYLCLSYPLLWILAAIGGSGALVLTVSHVGPFARLAQSYDPQWLAIVRSATPYLFLNGWSGTDWTALASSVALGTAGISVATKRERKLILAVLLLALGGLALTAFGADIAHNVLFVSLQPWRALWLLTLTAHLALVLLLVRAPRSFVSREILACGALLAVCSSFWSGWATADIVILLGVGALAAELRLGRRLPMVVVVVLRTWSALALAVALAIAWKISSLPSFLRWTIEGLTSLAALYCLWRARNLASIPVAVFSGLALVAAVAVIDARSDWEKYVEAPHVEPELTSYAPPGKTIYWEQGLELQWLKLREPGYYSCLQRVGTMLSRDNAVDYDRRTSALRHLNTEDFGKSDGDICPMRADPAREGPANVAAFQAVCAALPDLDAVILLRPIPGGHPTIWRAPVPLMQMQEGKLLKLTLFYRYSCGDRFAGIDRVRMNGS
jgi:hypothetical protein